MPEIMKKFKRQKKNLIKKEKNKVRRNVVQR